MSRTHAGTGQSALIQQGYDYSPQQLKELSWGLRFTPLVCMALAVVGLATRQPAIHFTLAALGILPFWFPGAHPMDLLYNHVLRPLWGGVKLPPNPLPRRIACFMGGAMNLGIALSFVGGNLPLAYGLGAVLVVLQLVVITTHFCVASWMYELLMRALGNWVPAVPIDEAREMIAAGATLIDVRGPDEFARGHLPGARNISLETLIGELSNVSDAPVLVYCAAGVRSQKAVRLLRKSGLENAHNLGAMARMENELPR